MVVCFIVVLFMLDLFYYFSSVFLVVDLMSFGDRLSTCDDFV